MSPGAPISAHCSTPAEAPSPLPAPLAVTSGGRTTTLWGHHMGGDKGHRWVRSPRGLVASPWHLLCCGRRWRSPGASRCRPCGPSGACAESAGSAGSAGRWPGHCPGCPRRPRAQRQSARRCLGKRTDRGPVTSAVRTCSGAVAGTVCQHRSASQAQLC